MTTLIGLRDVCVDYPGLRALDAVTLEIRPGDVLAVVGANGSGKTTLLNVLTGQRQPSRGGVVGPEGRLSLGRPGDALERGIVLVPQEPLTAPTLPAWENLLLGRSKLAGRAPGRAERQSARDHVRRVLPHIDPDRSAGELRKADRALLALERGMLLEPTVLALDEPTAVLGEQGVEVVESAARTVRDKSGAVVLVSHRLKDVVRLATRVAVLVDGRLVLDRPIGEVSVEEIVDTLAAGRGMSAESGDRRRAATESGDVVLDVTTTRELSGLEIDGLTVHTGEIVGVAGMAGSGRSRLCKLVAGVQGKPHGVSFMGRPLPRSTPACRSAGIAFIPEDRLAEGVFPVLSIGRNIEIGDLVRRSLAHVLPPSPRRKRTDGIVESFGIKAPSTAVDVTALSGGNAQRVVVARELMNEPSLLIADEPTQGVDRTGRTAIHALLRDFAARGGAVLVVSSEFEEIQGLADRIFVMADGRVVGHVSPDATYAELVTLASGLAPVPSS
ncbi:sugar ABC transporter ATP-binding protein [Streptomyces samsunensis]|uniref:ATP-binding cassette domain-containing protein n=1 Tax=Streptomyces malaysiensis TaxID=92644 RepID=UPI001582651D|nr:sugar ABC transporter ATP-binding protein [Streptomyces samsunensis]NUH40154.1 sugar ABC transporter ATP-binding protein [Streptomyces samsunensis]